MTVVSTFVPDRSPVELQMPPAFDSLDAERQHRKERLAGALRLFGRLGFGEGVAGHITARDPELTDHFWVNPFGMSFRHVRASDLLLVDHDGEVVHGLFTVGESVDEAAWWFITMERSCQAQLLAEAAGTPKLIPDDAARFTRDQTGFPLAGWLSFQPLWDEITRTDPELFA